uniref:Uncharacterized protein n=1 Tax=Anguilla anguilla TaxID=7936 RepID=A0A0E9STI0_ANGAN
MERIKHSRALLHPVSSEPNLPLYGLLTGLPARPFYQAARNAEPKTRHCTKVVSTRETSLLACSSKRKLPF